MRCCSCGRESISLPTVRWRRGEGRNKFVLCSGCLDRPLRSFVWIVPGDVPVTARCDRCGHYLSPDELHPSTVKLGAAKRDVYTGLCAGCVR